MHAAAASLVFWAVSACAQKWDGATPILLDPPALDAPAPDARPVSAPNVILVTFDGVRWQEFLRNRPDPLLSQDDSAPLLPYFWSTLARQGVVYGSKAAGGSMTISNGTMWSMPGYQSIMAGFQQTCLTNFCGRIRNETFPERLVRAGFKRSEVATVASWIDIPLAVERRDGSTYTDAGSMALTPIWKDPDGDDPFSRPPRLRPLSFKTRPDSETFSRAMDYLKTHKPRFLFISLNDSDKWGHQGEYKKYIASLRQYDEWLRELTAALESMGEYGKNTTLIVTTDHGRGAGRDWDRHGLDVDARAVWLYAKGPSVPALGPVGGSHEHVDIRPTVESLLGLKPISCIICGKPLPEIVGKPSLAGDSASGPFAGR